MGMIGHLKAITTEELARFLACSTEDEIASLLDVNGELALFCHFRQKKNRNQGELGI
jgi:hypothetical protein